MLSNIVMNLNVIESMMFFWQSVLDREKVGEYYLTEVAQMPEMKVLYDDEFNEESVRKVLSAITNRERLNTTVQKERLFWNKNMRVTEDRDLLNNMISPIKVLSLNTIVSELNSKADIDHEKIEIVFIPGLNEISYKEGNKLFVNFFNIITDELNGTDKIEIDGKPLIEYIVNRILEMNHVTLK